MDFGEIVRRRRMVRNYRSDPIPTEVIERIVDSGRRAPSAGFTQGQTFVVVTDPNVRTAVASLAGEADYVAAGFDPWISAAPVHIVVCTSEAAYHRRYQEADKLRGDGSEIPWPVPYWWVDAGAAMMMLLLAAVNEGLAAGFLGVHSLPGLKELLELSEEETPVGVVTMGHRAPDRRSGSLARGRRQDQVRWR